MCLALAWSLMAWWTTAGGGLNWCLHAQHLCQIAIAVAFIGAQCTSSPFYEDWRVALSIGARLAGYSFPKARSLGPGTPPRLMLDRPPAARLWWLLYALGGTRVGPNLLRALIIVPPPSLTLATQLALHALTAAPYCETQMLRGLEECGARVEFLRLALGVTMPTLVAARQGLTILDHFPGLRATAAGRAIARVDAAVCGAAQTLPGALSLGFAMLNACWVVTQRSVQ